MKKNGVNSLLKAATKAMLFAALVWLSLSCDGGTEPEPGLQPLLELLSPNGGETFRVGDEMVIKWRGRTESDSLTGVDFLFSPDNGMTFKIINDSTIFTEDPSWGAYRWTVPEQVGYSAGTMLSTVSSSCYLKIQEYETDRGIEDFSDSTFTITTP